jgi:hypothetical protein
MTPVCPSETSVKFYRYTWRHILEDSVPVLHTHFCESLKTSSDICYNSDLGLLEVIALHMTAQHISTLPVAL